MKVLLNSPSPLNRIVRRILGCACALVLFGCGQSTVTSTRYVPMNLPMPDRVLVYNFAVTPEEVDLDRGLGPTVLRQVTSKGQSQEEIKLGHAVANALTNSLVEDLRKQGINAYRAANAAPPGPTTASVKGRFMRIDQGDRSMRTIIGFGLGASQVRTHVQIYQGAGRRMRLVAEGDTVTKSNLKPGLGPMLGLGAVTGGLAVAGAVGGTTTIANEAILATVQHDAERTAKEIAQRIGNYYRQRGWAF
jgi:hypothetical protein